MTRPLYCDESIWLPVADGLARRGWTVHTVRDEQRLGDTDREHLRYAVENDWILLTFDDDFLSLVEGQGLDHAGILYVQQAGKQIGDVVKTVDAALDAADDELCDVRYL